MSPALRELLDELLVERYRPARLPPVSGPRYVQDPLPWPEDPAVCEERRRRLSAAIDGRHLVAVPDPPSRRVA